MESCDFVSELFPKLCGNCIADLGIEFLDIVEVLEPIFGFNAEDGLEVFDGELVAGFDLIIETFEVDILGIGDISDRSFLSADLVFTSLENPFEDTEVIAEAGPHELAFVIESEPVDVEDLRKLCCELLHVEPMCEVVAHVVAAEGKHSHRIASDNADSTGGSSGGF